MNNINLDNILNSNNNLKENNPLFKMNGSLIELLNKHTEYLINNKFEHPLIKEHYSDINKQFIQTL
jgi:hypothetical protein